MHLAGQHAERGYAMAALLVMISIMAIAMSALLPVWRHQAQREKEAELAFRGEQYARAIYLFRTKNGNQPPPNVDVLVDGRYLRKKYKDPITGEDFQPIYGGQQPQAGPQGRGGTTPGRGGMTQGRGGVTPGLGGATPAPGSDASAMGAMQSQGGPGQGRAAGAGAEISVVPGQGRSGAATTSVGGASSSGAGLITVQSKSKAPSIRIYNNAAHYNEWQFLYNALGRGGAAGDGGRSGTPGASGGRGSPTPGRGGAGDPASSPRGGGRRGLGPGGFQ